MKFHFSKDGFKNLRFKNKKAEYDNRIHTEGKIQ